MNIIIWGEYQSSSLWPLTSDSNRSLAEQLCSTSKNHFEPTVSSACVQLKKEYPAANIVIAAQWMLEEYYKDCNEAATILPLPCDRGTFCETALSCLWLREKRQVFQKEPIIVCRAESLLKPEFRSYLQEFEHRVRTVADKLMVLECPTSERAKMEWRYPAASAGCDETEKEVAGAMKAVGALCDDLAWGFSLQYMLTQIEKRLHCNSYQALLEQYHELELLDLETVVVEQDGDIVKVAYPKGWLPLPLWDVVKENAPQQEIGNVFMRDDCENALIVNQTHYPMVCAGIRNMVVAASPAGILITNADDASSVAEEVKQMKLAPLLWNEGWGSTQVLDQMGESRVVKLTVLPGRHTSYHAHTHREERWLVISGFGQSVVEGIKQPIRPGDMLYIRQAHRHAMIADSELQIIELQTGKIDDGDKKEFEWLF